MLAHLDDEEALTVEAVEILLHKPIALVLDHVVCEVADEDFGLLHGERDALAREVDRNVTPE